jgi:6,7-dimethyl-8-ribityllumazine synthase
MSQILIIEARFYDHIADGLLAGAVAEFDKAGVTWTKILVPGIYEIPAALSMVLTAEEEGTGPHYDGFLALGCAIRGESDHYHYICSSSMNDLSKLAVECNIALGNGILTVHDEAQALDRSDPARKNIGALAARACLRMVAFKNELKL